MLASGKIHDAVKFTQHHTVHFAKEATLPRLFRGLA